MPGIRLASTGLLALPLVSICFSGVTAYAAATIPTLAPFSDLGCHKEPPRHDGRALKGASYSSDDGMTKEACGAFCSEYNYFGVEFGKECFCGNAITPGADLAEGDCTMACTGDAAQTCGAGDRLNIYQYDGYAAPAVATVTGYTYKGCHSEAHSGRALPAKVYTREDLTPQICADLCQADNYAYAGLEWGKECWCDNTIRGGEWVDESQCSKVCAGDAHSLCGEGGHLNIYGPEMVTHAEVDGWSYAGCFVDSVGSRVLSGKQTGSDDMTAAKCAETCADFDYFGVEFGTQCFCGRTLTELPVDEEQCWMTCGGQGDSVCGGPDRINVWSTAGAAQNKQTVGAYRYLECGIDSVSQRVLSDKFSGAAGMTLEACAGFCAGFEYFGVEFGKECYCGNAYGGAEADDAGDCFSRCEGDATELCGGEDRISVYTTVPRELVCNKKGWCGQGGGPLYWMQLNTDSAAECQAAVLAASPPDVVGFWWSEDGDHSCYGLKSTPGQCGFVEDARGEGIFGENGCPVIEEQPSYALERR
jgi:hypothetical protein